MVPDTLCVRYCKSGVGWIRPSGIQRHQIARENAFELYPVRTAIRLADIVQHAVAVGQVSERGIRDRLRGESRDVLIAGHYPHLPRLLALLLNTGAERFPQNGVVALQSDDEGETFSEEWRRDPRADPTHA